MALTGVLFDFNKASLEPESAPVLQRVLSLPNGDPVVLIERERFIDARSWIWAYNAARSETGFSNQEEFKLMKSPVNASRLPWMALVAMVAVTGATPTWAGPTQATKDRCTAYAKRAVEQYQLMTSHQQCLVTNDPLTWQGSYDNHYNGCVLLPESLAKVADAGRDNHLQACGALSDGAAAAAPSAMGGAASATADTGSSATGTPAVAAAAAGAGPSTAGSAQCSRRPPDYYYTMKPTPIGGGTNPTFGPGTITFTEFLNTAPAVRKKVTYLVQRPPFELAYAKCMHSADTPGFGYWVPVGGPPRYFAMGGQTPTLIIWSVTAQDIAKMLGN